MDVVLNVIFYVIVTIAGTTKGISYTTWQYWVILACLVGLQITNSMWRD